MTCSPNAIAPYPLVSAVVPPWWAEGMAQYQSTDKQTVELLAQNAELEQSALEYQALLGAGEQLARTLEVLDARMPEEFWLSRLESRYSFDPELGVHEGNRLRPISSIGH